MSFITYGHGAWNPLIWLGVLLVMGGLVILLRSRGRNPYKKETAQTDVFISGNPVNSAEQLQVKAHNIYWGFFEAFKGFFNVIIRPHTGIINDYILWLVGSAGLAILLVLLAG